MSRNSFLPKILQKQFGTGNRPLRTAQVRLVCRVTGKVKYTYNNKELYLTSILDMKEVFDNTASESIIQAPRTKVIDESRCEQID